MLRHGRIHTLYANDQWYSMGMRLRQTATLMGLILRFDIPHTNLKASFIQKLPK